jgi:hypothetical protein
VNADARGPRTRAAEEVPARGRRQPKPAGPGAVVGASPPVPLAAGEPGKAPHASLAFATPAVRERLARLGIRKLADLVLHLPLRYEDETQLAAIARAPSGETVQIEGVVAETKVHYRPRRQLVSQIEDDSGTLHVRFFNFYPSQQKALAPGTKVRVIGEIRQGFFGAEMVHPRYRVVRGEVPLPQSLTPVYPTTAGLGQDPAQARRACTARRRSFRHAAGTAAAASGLAAHQVRRTAGAATVDARALPARPHPARRLLRCAAAVAALLETAAVPADPRAERALAADP